MLLVSGVLDEVDGMVAVFQVASSGDTGVYNGDMSLYSMIAMVPNNPYDVMGSWCGNSAWLYGNLVPLADTFDIDAEIRIMNHLTPSSAESDLVMKLRHFHNDGSFYSRCLVVASLSRIAATNNFPRNSGHSNNIITTIGTVAEHHIKLTIVTKRSLFNAIF